MTGTEDLWRTGKALGHPREPNTPRHGPEPLSQAHGHSHPKSQAPPLTTVLLILAVPTVVLPIAAENAGDAAVGVGALELAGQADVDVWGGGDTVRGCQARCGGTQGTRGDTGNLPQLASSELSWQSLSPSQMKAGLVQIPVEHWNWPGLHLNSAVG